MLEDRPLVQRSLVAAGAFSFVFSAAMAGTAFMLTGGFGYSDDNNPSVRSPDYGYEFAFATVPTAPYVEAGWTQRSSFDNGAPLEARRDTRAREDLEGEADTRMVSLQSVDIPDTYEMAAQETEEEHSEPVEAYPDDDPLPPEIADAKAKDDGVY